MPFQAPITILRAVDNIESHRYLMPAIQRDFVWDDDQIVTLFDSLMREFPIGSFLMWKVEGKNIQKYKFYEFIKDYHERDNRYINDEYVLTGQNELTAILDGQQRLTALYIGLKGSYACKLPRKRWESNDAFPQKELYLNLLSAPIESDLKFDFRFLTSRESSERTESLFWFKVKDILGLTKEFEVNNYLIENGLMQVEKARAQFANETLFRLHSTIHKDLIVNYYEDSDFQLDKVLNIFVRVNSGGTILSYSDLLLSIATAQWTNVDAKKVIKDLVDDLNRIPEGFAFSQDFVLKACLVLCDITEIAFKVDNFDRATMLSIENQWERVASVLKTAVELIATFGYSRYNLTSNAAVIPISYYLLHRNLPSTYPEKDLYRNDRALVKKWLAMAQLKRVFGGSPDSVLRPIRDLVRTTPGGFPLQDIVERFRGTNKSLVFDKEDIDGLFAYEYGKGYTFATLSVLYPTLDLRNRFHVDHIFPKSQFTFPRLRQAGLSDEDAQFCMDNFNRIANLQLLEGLPNQEKSAKDFAMWLNETFRNVNERSDYLRRNMVSEIVFDLAHFRDFIEQRTALMSQRLNEVLQ